MAQADLHLPVLLEHLLAIPREILSDILLWADSVPHAIEIEVAGEGPGCGECVDGEGGEPVGEGGEGEGGGREEALVAGGVGDKDANPSTTKTPRGFSPRHGPLDTHHRPLDAPLSPLHRSHLHLLPRSRTQRLVADAPAPPFDAPPRPKASAIAIEEAALHGHTSVLRQLVATHPYLVPRRALHVAATHGHLGATAILTTHLTASKSLPPPPTLLASTVASGHLAVAKHLLRTPFQHWTPLDAAFITACTKHHTPVLRFLLLDFLSFCDLNTLRRVLDAGDLQDATTPGPPTVVSQETVMAAIDRAIAAPHLDVITELLGRHGGGVGPRRDLVAHALARAAGRGALEVVRCVVEVAGISPPPDAAAAADDDTDANADDAPVSLGPATHYHHPLLAVLPCAAGSGNLELVAYVAAQAGVGASTPTESLPPHVARTVVAAVEHAAQRGHKDVVRLLLGFLPHRGTSPASGSGAASPPATAGGRRAGPPRSASVDRRLRGGGVGGAGSLSSAAMHAAIYGHLGVLREIGGRLKPSEFLWVVRGAVASGSVAAVRYCFSRMAGAAASASGVQVQIWVDEACRRGRAGALVEVWRGAGRRVVPSRAAVVRALGDGHLGVLLVLGREAVERAVGGASPREEVFKACVVGGHAHVAEHLLGLPGDGSGDPREFPGCSLGTLAEAARQGHLDVLELARPVVALHCGDAVTRLPRLREAVASVDAAAAVARAVRPGGDLSDLVIGAVREGQADVVRFLMDAYGDRLAVMEAALAAAVDGDEAEDDTPAASLVAALRSAFTSAAESGKTDALELLAGPRAGTVPVRFAAPAFLQASAQGRMDVLGTMLAHAPASTLPIAAACVSASERGQLEVLRVLVAALDEPVPPRAMDTAAGEGHAAVVQLLLEVGAACTTDAMDRAAAGGYLDVVRVLHEARGEVGCTTAAMDGAAGNGHLETVQFLRAQRPVPGCTVAAVDVAASRGFLEVVRFLVEEGVDGSAAAVDSAAGNGHLAVVRYLCGLEGGRPAEVRGRGVGIWCTKEALYGAAKRGRVEVVEVLMEAGCPGSWELALRLACSWGKLGMAEFIRCKMGAKEGEKTGDV
ncbi:hypothetical protein HDU96_008892 [Phlyctochytrium bullatum]|nr:hypothetical protein HDU96_008892 [Phlyctochytrium bullatum]